MRQRAVQFIASVTLVAFVTLVGIALTAYGGLPPGEGAVKILDSIGDFFDKILLIIVFIVGVLVGLVPSYIVIVASHNSRSVINVNPNSYGRGGYQMQPYYQQGYPPPPPSPWPWQWGQQPQRPVEFTVADGEGKVEEL